MAVNLIQMLLRPPGETEMVVTESYNEWQFPKNTKAHSNYFSGNRFHFAEITFA